VTKRHCKELSKLLQTIPEPERALTLDEFTQAYPKTGEEIWRLVFGAQGELELAVWGDEDD